MAGVGSGTTVEFIQVHNSSDDGIEIFGGNVNLRRIVITGADDDGLDTDTGWRGGAQFGIVTQRAAGTASRSAGFEFSSAPAATPLASRYVSRPFISNWTLVGRNATIDAHTVAHFDTGTDATVINSVFTAATGSVAGCTSATSKPSNSPRSDRLARRPWRMVKGSGVGYDLEHVRSGGGAPAAAGAGSSFAGGSPAAGTGAAGRFQVGSADKEGVVEAEDAFVSGSSAAGAAAAAAGGLAGSSGVLRSSPEFRALQQRREAGGR